MKSEVILEAIGKADNKYIEEAAPKEKRDKNYRRVKRSAVAAAACLVLIIYAAASKFLPIKAPESSASSEKKSLPMLTISSKMESMGFEASMAYDFSELADGNPWTADTKLGTLPVYKNKAYDSTGEHPNGISKKSMLKLAKQAANALDMKITDIKYKTVCGTLSAICATTAAAKITVLKEGCITVSFSSSVKLPEKYVFTYSNTSNEEANSVTDYLIKRFSNFLSFSKPQKALFADYNFDGSRNISYYAYSADGGITEQILNYNFNKAEFAPDDNGNLMLIRKDNGLLRAEKIGDYPLITSAEAFKLLLNGNYITSVPEKMPGEKYVVKTELIYRTSNIEKTFLPYYRFLAELPDMREKNGLKAYGAYYVPAVQQKYISNMPLWDGSFN